MSANQGRTARERRIWHSIWVRLGVLVAVVVAAYLALAFWQNDRIASGTTVAGAEVGGLSQDAARERVSRRAADLSTRPVVISLGEDQQIQLVPKQAGLRVDVDRSLENLSESAFNPAVLLKRFTGGDDRPAVVVADRSRLSDAIGRAVGAEVQGAPKDGAVSLSDGQVNVVRSTAGRGVDTQALAGQIAQQWPQKRQFATQLADREPTLTNAEIDRFVKEFATPAVSGELKLTRGDHEVEISPRQIGELVSVRSANGRLTPVVDGKKLAALALDQEPRLEEPPTNPRIRVVGSTRQVTPGKNGTTVDATKLGQAAVAALSSPTRTLAVPVKASTPSMTVAQARALDTTSVVSTFSSKFPGGYRNEARTKNIRLAMSKLDGIVVAPGQQFSLINALGGEVTKEQGYVEAPTIQGGVERGAVGGGISQVSTTVYNTAFLAGVQLDEHKAHSFYIDRYPMGREATLWIPTIDNTWTNDTGAPIVISAGVKDSAAVMTFYGKKVFSVSSTTSGKYAFSSPKTVNDSHIGCIRLYPQQGFSVDVTRVVKRGGQVVKNEKIHTTYNPTDDVRCTHPRARGY